MASTERDCRNDAKPRSLWAFVAGCLTCRRNGLSTATRAVHRLLGGVLLFAAVLKAAEIAAQPYNQYASHDSLNLYQSVSALIFVLAVAEMSMAIWLLSGYRAHLARIGALLAFGAFSVHSVFSLMADAPSCGCFGPLVVNPAVTLTFDLIAVVLLVWCLSHDRQFSFRGAHFPCNLGVTQFVLPTLLCLGLAVGTYGYFVESPGAHSSKALDGLMVREADLNLGLMWPVPCERVVHVHNTSRHTIEVVDILASCGCTSVSPKSFALAPLGNQRVELRIDPSRFVKSQMPEAGPLPFTVALTPIVNRERKASQAWHFHGQVETAIQPSLTRLDYGDELVSGNPFYTTHFNIRSQVPLRSVDVKPAETVNVLIDKAASTPTEWIIHVTPSSRLAPGPFNSNIEIMPNLATPGHIRMPRTPFNIPVFADIQPVVHATPRRLMLGASQLGTSLAADVTISSSNTPFSVSGAHCPNFDAHVSITGDSPGCSVLLRMSLNVMALGHQESTLNVDVTQEANGVKYTVQVPVSYYGVSE